MPTHPLLPGAVAITLGANPRPELTAHQAPNRGLAHGVPGLPRIELLKAERVGGRPLTRRRR
jgi:hypothetical protein